VSHSIAPLLLAAVAAFALCRPVAAADPPKGLVKPIDPDGLKELQGAVEGSSEFAELTKGKRVVLSSLVGYSDKAAETDATASEFAEALHFNYDDGKTIRTVYNRTAKKVVKSEALSAYPTPLAGEEVAAARKLAEEKDEKVKALVANTPAGDLTVSTLAPVVSKKDHPNYGKRLAVLIYSPKGKLPETQKVLVNLTDKTVSRD
jgi:hypothetical protein